MCMFLCIRVHLRILFMYLRLPMRIQTHIFTYFCSSCGATEEEDESHTHTLRISHEPLARQLKVN